MKYLLTQKELDDLHRKATELDGKTKADLQAVCTLAANHVPVSLPWKGPEERGIWGCILTTETEHYCDECPVRNACPYPNKEWSQ